MSRFISRQLADVNVLLALLWPLHVHHAAAQAWFAAQGHRGWATNSITQLGVLRLLTNPAITKDAVHASGALAALTDATQHPGHEFWPLDQPPTTTLPSSTTALTGHSQWTDALLLRHAVERNGKLVTFDGGLSAIAGKESAAHLLVLRD
jgi:uncharacterized protein